MSQYFKILFYSLYFFIKINMPQFPLHFWYCEPNNGFLVELVLPSGCSWSHPQAHQSWDEDSWRSSQNWWAWVRNLYFDFEVHVSFLTISSLDGRKTTKRRKYNMEKTANIEDTVFPPKLKKNTLKILRVPHEYQMTIYNMYNIMSFASICNGSFFISNIGSRRFGFQD